MKCPFCSENDNKVVDKRDTENGLATRRRRECLSCNKRFTTYERIESINLIVIKKNQAREPFDKAKVEKGVMRALEKRPVSMERMKDIVDEIESELLNKNSTEIPSKVIGNSIMRKLKKADKVAYIRFASVYRDFEDVEEFQKEVTKLTKKGG
ncbi:transcriptional regulator NrdR [Candidatus Woesearchaeota archaeon]|nr:transcriptional regulator NrdR [Candidatus Woesearchaeota archaeon]